LLCACRRHRAASLNEAEISVRLRFMGSYRGKFSFSLPMHTNMACRTPKHNDSLTLIRE